MIDRRIFAADDYNIIYKRYFAELRRQNRIDADPSGWLDTFSVAERLLQPHPLPKGVIARYFIDEGRALGEHKERICSFISKWERSTVGFDGLTLCPSCGNASLITLATLKEMGASILFETPAYFATIEQAQILGVPFELIPTYHNSEYSLPVLDSKIRDVPVPVVWLTQPRASLGFDQSKEMVHRLLRKIGRRGYLVIDEATDQSYPSHFGQLFHEFREHRLIRLRSFTKGMGLNGFRLAAIIHPVALRPMLTDAIEALGGSLDAHSLFAVAGLGDDPLGFARMLAAANHQVNGLRAVAERLVRGGPITVNRLTNGYIGSMVVDLSLAGRTDRSRRKRLLEWCRLMRTPVILGASMYIAKAPPTETIRLNFFSSRHHITRGIANILKLWEEI